MKENRVVRVVPYIILCIIIGIALLIFFEIIGIALPLFFKTIIVIVAVIIGIASLVRAWMRRDRFNRIWRYYAVFGVISLIIASLGLIPNANSSAQVPIPPATSGKPVCGFGTITIDGSTAMQPLVSEIASKYVTICDHSANITVTQSRSSGCSDNSDNNQDTGSGQGLNDLENGTIDIADSDTLAPNTAYNLTDHVVAAVVDVLVLNLQGNSFTNLSTADIQNIYNGTYTNWNQLDGPDLRITAIGRRKGSGTRATFDQYVLGKSPETSDVDHLRNTTSEVICDVERTPGAIGYVSLHDAQIALSRGEPLLILDSIDQHRLSDCVNDGYKFWSLEHMYTGPKSRRLAQDVINFMGNTTYAQPIIQRYSFRTTSEMVNVLATHYQP